MALAVDQRQQQQEVVFVYDAPTQQEQPQKRVATVQQQGLELIQGLQGRVRETEAALGVQQVQNQKQAMQHETQLFRVTREREQAERQARELQEQYQQQQQLLQQMQAQQGQDQQLIGAQREEIADLQAQVERLGQQLQRSTERVEALERQIQRMAIEADQQRSEILEHVRRFQPADDLGTQAVAAIGRLFRDVASLFDPSLDTSTQQL